MPRALLALPAPDFVYTKCSGTTVNLFIYKFLDPYFEVNLFLIRNNLSYLLAYAFNITYPD